MRGKELIPLLPVLEDFCKSKGRKKSLLKKLSDSHKDHTCRLVELAFKLVPKKRFTPAQLKSLYVRSDALKFMRDYNKCSASRRECLRGKRDSSLLQSGGSLSLLLGVVVPIIADLVYTKLIKPALSGKKAKK